MTADRAFLPAALRVAAAAAVAVGSFVALRQRYHGDCVIPDYDLERYAPFLLFAVLFMIAFVWVISELAFLVLAVAVGMRPLPARLLSMGAALATYLVVGYSAWLSSPTPVDAKDDGGLRAFMSVFWSAGILLKTGNFSDWSCGY